ncbi:MAG: ATP-binding protein [Clostridiales bacterium]|nr:ATP-binding protein [Clostridiales bacterium]
MRKTIYTNMLFITISVVLVTAVLLALVFYSFIGNQAKLEIAKEAQYFSKALALENNPVAYLESLRLTFADNRVTLISAGGEVLFDSYSDVSGMENHAERPEVKQAVERGYGESKRLSATLGEDSYYYAIRLDGNSILRIAKTTKSMSYAFLSLLAPFIAIVLLVIIATYIVSHRLTRRIIDPINSIDPVSDDNEYPYDELAPFLLTISRQKDQIREQIEALDEHTRTIQTIIEDMREGLILLDSYGRILASNISAMKLFNANAKEYMNKNILELTRQHDFLEKVKTALGGEAADATYEFLSRTIQVFFDPIYKNNHNNGAILLFLDITEKANAEKLRREFTANVSHELKTPLTVISGLSEMIVLGMAKEEDRLEFSRKIKNETERMISLVNDILKLSEFDEAQAIKHFDVFNLYDLAEESVFTLSSFAGEKKISVDILGERFEIEANRNMVAELLYNLIENAIKYNVEGGKISVVLSKNKSEAVIEVSDTGIGIDSEHLPRIFERFYRVDKSRSKKTGGTGLGLSIVKHIAQYHNGSVSVESSLGQGTKITATLKSSV